jgi:hypothetical protein
LLPSVRIPSIGNLGPCSVLIALAPSHTAEQHKDDFKILPLPITVCLFDAIAQPHKLIVAYRIPASACIVDPFPSHSAVSNIQISSFLNALPSCGTIEFPNSVAPTPDCRYRPQPSPKSLNQIRHYRPLIIVVCLDPPAPTSKVEVPSKVTSQTSDDSIYGNRTQKLVANAVFKKRDAIIRKPSRA